MPNPKLQKILSRIDEVDPREIKELLKSVNGNEDPEISSHLLAVRDRLNGLLAVVNSTVEGGYRQPPIISPDNTANQENQTAIVPVSQASQILPIGKFNPKEKEKLSGRKLKILQAIDYDPYKEMLKPRLDRISVKSLELLSRLDAIIYKYNHRELFEFNQMTDLMQDIVLVTALIIDAITSQLPDQPLEKNAWFPKDPQYEAARPFIDYLCSELKITGRKISMCGGDNNFYGNRINFLDYLAKLFSRCPSELFTSKLCGGDSVTSGFPAKDSPVALFLAGNGHFYSDVISRPQEFVNGIQLILPKINGLLVWNKWARLKISGDDRRVQLKLLVGSISLQQLENLELVDCDNFLVFLARPDARKHFEKFSNAEKTAFILGRDYTMTAMVKQLSTPGT